MTQAQKVESYLRPGQVQELENEKSRITHALKNNKDQIQDVADARKQVRKIDRMLDEQAAPEITGEALDAAVARRDELQAEILKGMPSHEEMRKCPPGAVNKHITWEKRNKDAINEWKNLQLQINRGTDDADIANIETLRPSKSTLNMHNSIVEGSTMIGIDTAAPTTVLTSEDLKLIKERAPAEVSGKLCLMDAEQRAIVKMQYVTDYEEPAKEPGGSKLSLNKGKK